VSEVENGKKLPVPPIGKEVQTEKDWIECCDVLPDYIAHIPAGHIRPIAGSEIWVDAYGDHYSREAFKEKHGVDPEPAWKAVKEYLKKYGKGVRKAVD
jgi:hypothetical protein